MIADRNLSRSFITAALIAVGVLFAAAPASAAEFPKKHFKKCFDGSVSECANDLHTNWRTLRKYARPACKTIWPENSTERFVCDYLFGAVVATGQAPAPSKCAVERDELKKKLAACEKEHAGGGECDCEKAKSDAQAVDDLQKELANTKDELEKAKAAANSNDELNKTKSDLEKCKKDLASARNTLSENPINDTQVRVGGAAIVGGSFVAPALSFDIAHRLWGTTGFDLDITLNTENFLLPNKESGIIAAGGLEFNWVPHHADSFSYELGGQVAYSAVLTGHATNWRYGNGGWLGLHFIATWRVASEWGLGFRINANGLATSGPVYYGIFGLDFVIEHHEPQGL